MSRRLVLVLGPGRSGTSAIAGALARCGYEVPGASIAGNESNPLGFYEPRWVVDFHAEFLDRVGFGALSPDPGGVADLHAATAEPQVVERLRSWLADTLLTQPRIVVKDPRTVWFQHLWAEAADAADVQPRYVTMLRHPAEVSASRAEYYGRGRGNKRRGDARRVAGWINVALLSHEMTHGRLRCFLRYDELLADWRSAMLRLCRQLDIEAMPAIGLNHHPIDDFIAPELNRHPADWNDLELPKGLRRVAEETWLALSDLARNEPVADADSRLATCRDSYRAALSEVSDQLGIDLAAPRPGAAGGVIGRDSRIAES
jgi:hypothetical protein